MLLLLSWYEFSDEKMQESDAFYECVTRPTNRPTDRPTDTAYYRDVRTHLKRKKGRNTKEKGNRKERKAEIRKIR